MEPTLIFKILSLDNKVTHFVIIIICAYLLRIYVRHVSKWTQPKTDLIVHFLKQPRKKEIPCQILYI